jgi:hypothetical protein
MDNEKSELYWYRRLIWDATGDDVYSYIRDSGGSADRVPASNETAMAGLSSLNMLSSYLRSMRIGWHGARRSNSPTRSSSFSPAGFGRYCGGCSATLAIGIGQRWHETDFPCFQAVVGEICVTPVPPSRWFDLFWDRPSRWILRHCFDEVSNIIIAHIYMVNLYFIRWSMRYDMLLCFLCMSRCILLPYFLLLVLIQHIYESTRGGWCVLDGVTRY